MTIAAAIRPSIADEPLRLPDGEPLVCIYYFGHWWDPWKTNDDAIRADFHRLRAMGFNTLCLDHEWTQAIDGNWKWLDREHRLAKEAGLSIIPWLSLKSWSDMSGEQRLRLAKEWYGEDIRCGESQDGKLMVPIVYDDSLVRFGATYACDYLRRYGNQALLHLRWQGRDRPVICLGVEAAWKGGFDARTTEGFRTWLQHRYRTIAEVNQRWGTDFADFSAIDPRDTTVFDYAHHAGNHDQHPQAVEDHIAFRAEMIADGLGRMAHQVRAAYPDVLILAEIPYQYGSRHPDAIAYRTQYAATPESCSYADIVMFRGTAPLTADEVTALDAAKQRWHQKFVLTYRTYSDWDLPSDSPKFAQAADLYAMQAAQLASGFGFYTWNEMVDTHVAYAPHPPKEFGWTQARSDRAAGLLAAMVKKYRELVGVAR